MSTTPTTPEVFVSQVPGTLETASVPHSATSSQDGTPQAPICPCAGKATPKLGPWETCLDYAKKHVNGEVEVWKDELDKLLLFATLFAGVAGAFAIESYHSVKQDPTEKTVLLLRSILALQLNATNPQPSLSLGLDPRLIPITAADPQVPISATDKRISIYNFLSLILSLSVVMAGILCLQWLREYNQDPSGIPGPRREHLGIRYMRREGMKKWGVFRILKSLPLILLLSLLLFFAGIIELLIEVDKSATIVASIAIGITALFMWITTVLPTLQSLGSHFFPDIRFSECPYKSPQAWIIHQLIVPAVQRITRAIAKQFKLPLPEEDSDGNPLELRNWSSYDWLVYSGHKHSSGAISSPELGLHWLGRMYLQEKPLAAAFYRCIQTQDDNMHASLRHVLASRGDTRRKKSVDNAWQWAAPEINAIRYPALTGPGLSPADAHRFDAAKAHKSDVIVFQTLAHLAEKTERGHPPTVLLKQRLNLFFKINERHPQKDIDCPLVNDVDQSLLIDSATRRRLLRCIFKLMQNKDVGVNESHLLAVEHILELESADPDSGVELFKEAQDELNGWMDRCRSGIDRSSTSEINIGLGKLLPKATQVEKSVDFLRRLIANRAQS